MFSYTVHVIVLFLSKTVSGAKYKIGKDCVKKTVLKILKLQNASMFISNPSKLVLCELTVFMFEANCAKLKIHSFTYLDLERR